MSSRILVEFYSTCPGCRSAEMIVESVLAEPQWARAVEFTTYRRDEDPQAGDPTLVVTGPTLVVDRTDVIRNIGVYTVRAALGAARDRRGYA